MATLQAKSADAVARGGVAAAPDTGIAAAAASFVHVPQSHGDYCCYQSPLLLPRRLSITLRTTKKKKKHIGCCRCH
jgi:hypothetical protein